MQCTYIFMHTRSFSTSVLQAINASFHSFFGRFFYLTFFFPLECDSIILLRAYFVLLP
ncbi:hypothetical protein BCR43DRAFT_498607 [Syncephalastrum racemosum]|uniref:Uncharacterized protein n=1 Tax=Syncephalastrum racemosum TaxID=13706 RepID=A0A1X2H159_SYNRA|nr:hypothetical protein BCR43DRAFT_498607 [Syncephalastrum racemosum]